MVSNPCREKNTSICPAWQASHGPESRFPPGWRQDLFPATAMGGPGAAPATQSEAAKGRFLLPRRRKRKNPSVCTGRRDGAPAGHPSPGRRSRTRAVFKSSMRRCRPRNAWSGTVWKLRRRASAERRRTPEPLFGLDRRSVPAVLSVPEELPQKPADSSPAGRTAGWSILRILRRRRLGARRSPALRAGRRSRLSVFRRRIRSRIPSLRRCVRSRLSGFRRRVRSRGRGGLGLMRPFRIPDRRLQGQAAPAVEALAGSLRGGLDPRVQRRRHHKRRPPGPAFNPSRHRGRCHAARGHVL